MKNKRTYLIVLVLATVVIIGLLWVRSLSGVATRRSAEGWMAHHLGVSMEEFPDVDTNNLSDVQKRIIGVSRQEYAKKPISYDENVLTYSNGVREPWCADYVSWVMREAGSPLVNPNSGGWRIPGVLTLREYYKSKGRFKDAAGYTPKVGDVAIYVNTSSFNMSRQHTNIVLKVDGAKITTIGGNEYGRLRVITQELKSGVKGLVGYGVLPQ